MADVFLGTGDSDYTAAPGERVFGQDGDDTLRASATGNALYGGNGDDVVNGGAGNDTISGDDDTNQMGLNVLNGGGGDDVITSFSWDDQVSAGSGNDLVTTFAQQTGQSMDGGGGTDTINIRSLTGSTEPVNIIMGPTCVTTVGGVGGATYLNFEILNYVGGTGANTITGGSLGDFLLVAYTSTGSNAVSTFDAGFVKAGDGDDTVGFNGITASGTGIEELSGGKGTDRLTWTNGISAITDLTIDAKAGEMTGLGRVFARFDGFERIEITVFPGHTGALDYTGFDGVDSLNVEFTTADVDLGGGDDGISIGLTSGTIRGGSGNDGIFISYPSGAASAYGGVGDDMIRGGLGASSLYGDAGNDQIYGENSDSQLFGGADDDVLTLRFTSNAAVTPGAIYGGSGRDVAVVNFLSKAVAYDEDFSGLPGGLVLGDGTILQGVEAVQFMGGSGADILIASNDAGGALANALYGGTGNDRLTASSNGALLDGGFGNDTLRGGKGADSLNGTYSDDTVLGGLGDDSVAGGAGKDRVTGGGGADQFLFFGYFESGALDTTADVITDFKQAQLDRIGLAAIDANTINNSPAPTDDAFVFIKQAAFRGVAGELRFEKVNLAGTANDHTLVQGDINGNGVADFTIWLNGLIDLKAADFVL